MQKFANTMQPALFLPLCLIFFLCRVILHFCTFPKLYIVVPTKHKVEINEFLFTPRAFVCLLKYLLHLGFDVWIIRILDQIREFIQCEATRAVRVCCCKHHFYYGL